MHAKSAGKGIPASWMEQYSQRSGGGLEPCACRPEQEGQGSGAPRENLQLARGLLAYSGQPAENGAESGAFDALFQRP
jgi:hypothetical protein